jgi:hypothetical protein
MFRLTRSAAVCCIVGLPAGGLLRAQQFEYAAGTSHYRITTNIKLTQEAMGQKVDADVATDEKLTLSLARQAKDTLAMTVTIDSMASKSSMGPTPGMDSLVGAKILAWVSPSGQFYSSRVALGASSQVATVADEVSRLLPRIRAILVNGATWSDTGSSKTMQQGLEITRRVVSQFTVAGDTVFGTEKAWKLSRKSSATTAGSGQMQGQAMSMQGSSNGTGVLYLTAKGVFIGGEITEDAKATITLAASGMEVNVLTQARTRFERLD